MAYSEQSASSPDDVINKISAFAVANGWAEDRNNLVGSNRTVTLHRSGVDYIHLYNNTTTDIKACASTGYSSGSTPDLQPGVSVEALTNVDAGPYTKIYMFADTAPAPHLHVVVEMANGVFRHMSFGALDKIGTWTGGTYVDGHYWYNEPPYDYRWVGQHSPLFDSYSSSLSVSGWGSVRCDIDSQPNPWANLRNASVHQALTGLWGGASESASGVGGIVSQFVNRNDPPFSGQITAGPIRVDIRRAGGLFSVAGTIPNVRYLNVLRFNPAQEISIGTDTWKVFPMVKKGAAIYTAVPNPLSGNNGYAYKKTA